MVRRATKIRIFQAPQPKKEGEKLRLDLGCGVRPKNGFTGVDITPFVPGIQVVDLLSFPWPWDDESVDEVYAAHFLEHLSGEERVPFFNELYRVMKPQAKATFITPDWKNERAYGDPTHKWPPVSPWTYLYLGKKWREGEKEDRSDANAPHSGYTCDFDFSYGWNIHPDFATRSMEVQTFAVAWYANSAVELIANLTRREGESQDAEVS